MLDHCIANHLVADFFYFWKRLGHIGGEAGVSFIIKGVTITVKLYGPPSASNVMNSFKPKGVVRNSTYKCSRPKRWLKYSHSHKPVVSKTLEKGYHFQLSIFVCSAYCCGQKTTNTNIQEYGNLLGKAIFQGSSSRSEKKSLITSTAKEGEERFCIICSVEYEIDWRLISFKSEKFFHNRRYFQIQVSR